MEQSEVDLVSGNSDENPIELNQDSILGKFASVDELAKAYEQLQSAFTKKAQELSALQKVAEGQLAEMKDKASVAITKEVKPIPQVIAGNSGNFAITNVSEARTLHATTKVAENFFRTKGDKNDYN